MAEIEVIVELTEGVALPEAALALVEQAVKATLEKKTGASQARQLQVSVTLTSDAEIQRLNYAYRRINTPTDVLSFALCEGDPEPSLPSQVPLLLGEIVISYETAVRQADIYGHPLTRELAFLAVHGTLHLLGFDHMEPKAAQVMRQWEELILEELGQTR